LITHIVVVIGHYKTIVARESTLFRATGDNGTRRATVGAIRKCRTCTGGTCRRGDQCFKVSATRVTQHTDSGRSIVKVLTRHTHRTRTIGNGRGGGGHMVPASAHAAGYECAVIQCCHIGAVYRRELPRWTRFTRTVITGSSYCSGMATRSTRERDIGARATVICTRVVLPRRTRSAACIHGTMQVTARARR